MMLWVWLVMPSVFAQTPCIQEHLEQATALNQERKPLYSALTQGRSESISDRLIQFEQDGDQVAKIFERSTSFYRNHGINLLCEELVSISETPQFAEKSTVPSTPIDQIRKPDIQKMMSDLTWAYQLDGFGLLQERAKRALEMIAMEPAHYCITRHFLESIYASAVFGPQYVQQATDKGYFPWVAKQISYFWIKKQIDSLTIVASIDEDAIPIQEEGIPILCQDVPPISNKFPTPLVQQE